ncbi:CYFA0S13e01244g1_1 [Cyberlindnera fabianii]|uniref:SURF1-like protein n=1 Tax=Cyberlindnera fabianii TaxID=36022 RepID=A0A061B2F2_CYBFA|nr:CYFA0S13e01244g1_1 [Cyberlindnera fabianii]
MLRLSLASVIRPAGLVSGTRVTGLAAVRRLSQLSTHQTHLRPCSITTPRFTLPHNNGAIRHTQRRTVITSNVDWKPVKTTEKEEWTLSKYIFLSLLILMPVISFMLGTWQMRRLKWKNNLIATCEDRLTYEPIPLPKNFDPEDAEDWQYRRVTVTGKFDHSREVFVGPKVKMEMKGYTLYTPLVRSDGGPDILVERGFVTDDKVIPTRRKLQHLSVPMHEVTVEALIKKINPKAALTMDKLDQDSRLWHVLDYNEMSEFTNTIPLHIAALKDLKDHPVETKVITEPKPWWNFWSKAKTHEVVERVDVKPDEVQEFSEYQLMKAGVPVGRTASLDIRNNHLQYIATWYGLCFASTILLFLVLRKKPKDPLQDKLKHARRHM